jgi:nucleoside 2-deoxyribosyltransferase
LRIYLAARYRRIEEMRRYAQDLAALGHQVTSRWIRGDHKAQVGLDHPSWVDIAERDVEDVASADAVIGFLEPQGGGGGGRHAEFGMALAWGKRTMVVGRPEHLFHTLPAVEAYPTWLEALEALR